MAIARDFYRTLHNMQHPSIIGNVVIYWEVMCPHAEVWEDQFTHGMLAAMSLVPILSWDSEKGGSLHALSSIHRLNDGSDHCDKCLLEWELALVLLEWKQSRMRGIIPIIRTNLTRAHLLSNLSDKPSMLTKAKLVSICEQYSIPISERRVRRSVRGTVEDLLDMAPSLGGGFKASDANAIRSKIAEVYGGLFSFLFLR